MEDWACRRSQNDEERCKSWIWVDETAQVERLVPRASIPRTPKKQLDIRGFGLLTPSRSSSGKRKRVDFGSGSRACESFEEEISDDGKYNFVLLLILRLYGL
jgi:hypothetical protein